MHRPDALCGPRLEERAGKADWIQTADGGWVKARVAQTRGLSREHNRFLKDIFKGAATTVITQRTKDRTGADARVEESVAMGEVRLAIRPDGRKD